MSQFVECAAFRALITRPSNNLAKKFTLPMIAQRDDDAQPDKVDQISSFLDHKP
jgi:hypothetical protein